MRKKNLLLVFGLFMVGVVLLANGPVASLQAGKAGLEVGDKALDFKLKNVDGKLLSMADFQDAKGFIVVFTCNTCPFSKMYENRIEVLNKKYASQGFPVLAINSNDKIQQPGDSYDEMVKRAADKSYSFPYLYDETQEIAKAYGASRTPHVYVISKQADGSVISYIGAIDDNHKDENAVTKKYVEEAVDLLLDGKVVKTTFTKAIGCTIKWREA